MQHFKPVLFVAALLLAPFAVAAQNDPNVPVAGRWLTGKQGVVIELFKCTEEGHLCGRVAWLKKPLSRDGLPKRDDKNPDPAKRDRLLCGATVIEGLEPAGDQAWQGGKVYNPKDGNSYDIKMTLRGDGTVRVRAFLGMEFLGKTEIWTRANGNVPPCAAHTPGA